MKIQNPIIRGFYPDPSVCKVGKKYYLASSSFQFFPGVPLFESEDLLNWKQIGHCLTRTDQVALHQIPSSGGVFAPTLRYHDGTFYMVTNNNTYNKNFYISTTDIYGEWSDPIFVDQEGIDPSLLFDGGKVYFTSNGTGEDGKPCILQCEIDIATGKKLTDSIPVWSGSGGRYLESPHLYHIGDWYYMMAAEGGTEYGHMITYARSKSPFGPFEGYAGNPVITNRNLGGNLNIVQGIGHGDLIQDEKGDYYIICLGFRQCGIWQAYHHLGREVFLTPVTFGEDGWFTAGDGVVREWMEVNLDAKEQKDGVYDVSFADTDLNDYRWCYLRDYQKENYCFEDGVLKLKGTGITLNEADTPTFVGIRQSEFETKLSVLVGGKAKEAGFTFYMDEDQHYDLFVEKDNDTTKVVLRIKVGDAQAILKEVEITSEAGEEQNTKESGSFIRLEADSFPEEYRFYYRNGEKREFLGSARSKYLSSEVAGGFTGVVMGLFAVDEKENQAEFKQLTWKQNATKCK